MTARRTDLVACFLVAAVFCSADPCSADSCSADSGRADSAVNDALTTAEYRAELDRLLSATQQLDSSGNPAPEALHDVPQSWRVHTDQREFEISTEGLQQDVRRYEKEKNIANATAIRERLQSLRNDLDGFEKPPGDVSANRTELTSILARPEFRESHVPKWLEPITKWLDEIKGQTLDFARRMLRFLFHMLQLLFHSTSIPTISRFVVYGLIGVAVLALAYFAYRTIWRGDAFEGVVPKDLPVSAKEWAVWLTEARAAAAKGEWREAIHLAYWAGISFLERQGTWKPDRARTPREYLRLLSSSSEHRETLIALTRIFELAWYAKRDASEGTFSQTLQELEKLGCH
jgi:hypothetical protein